MLKIKGAVIKHKGVLADKSTKIEVFLPELTKQQQTMLYELVMQVAVDIIFTENGMLDEIDTLHIIVNHWPSKRGGKRSIASRAAAAQLTRSIVDSLMNLNPYAKVIVMGDLNDDPDSKSILTHLKTKKKIEQTEPKDIYNPMYQMYKRGIGSYAYRDNWSLIDQIIISYGLLNPAKNSFKYVSAHVYTDPLIMLKTQVGSYEDYPYRTYAGGAYQGGYSDHFPVYIILKK